MRLFSYGQEISGYVIRGKITHRQGIHGKRTHGMEMERIVICGMKVLGIMNRGIYNKGGNGSLGKYGLVPNFTHFPDKSPINLSNGGNGTSDAKLPFNYELSKYIVNDVVGGQANMIGDYLVGNKNDFKPKVSSFSTLFLNGTKLGLGDNGPGWIKGVSDIHDGVLKSKEGYDSYNKVKNCIKAYKLTNLGAKAPEALLEGSKFGPPIKIKRSCRCN